MIESIFVERDPAGRISWTFMDEWMDCVFLNCHKALDTIPHRGTIKKPNIKVDVRGELSKYIHSYLSVSREHISREPFRAG